MSDEPLYSLAPTILWLCQLNELLSEVPRCECDRPTFEATRLFLDSAGFGVTYRPCGECHLIVEATGRVTDEAWSQGELNIPEN